MTRLLVLLLLAGAAHAQVTTLTYQASSEGSYCDGNYNACIPSNSSSDCNFIIPPELPYFQSSTDCEQFKVVLTAPLAPNLVNALIPPLSMRISSVSLTGQIAENAANYPIGSLPTYPLTAMTETPSQYAFFVTTNNKGAITAWNFFFSAVDASNTSYYFSGNNVNDLMILTYASGTGYSESSIGFGGSGGTWTQSALAAPPPPPPATVKVLDCTGYKVIAPSSSAILNVSPSASGSPSECKLPGSVPGSWYVKTTTNGGHTWEWTATLESLGL